MMTGDQTPESPSTPSFALEDLLNPQAISQLRQAAEISRQQGVTLVINVPNSGGESRSGYGMGGGSGATLSITPAWADRPAEPDEVALVKREAAVFTARLSSAKRYLMPLLNAGLAILKKIPGGDDKDGDQAAAA